MSDNKVRDAWRLIRAAANTAMEPRAKERIEEMDVRDHVDDFDFDEPVVAVGNWNEISVYRQVTGATGGGHHETLDVTPKRLARALEKIGVELAWSDCVDTCDDCNKLLNTNPHSYGWQPRYVCSEYGTCCLECLDPVQHLEGLEGQPNRANNVPDVDPTEHGYFLFEEGLEHGWHPGQDASPEVIAKAMRKRGIERFLFHIDDIGQFDMKFSVYVHEDERGKVGAKRWHCKGCGHDQAGDDCDELECEKCGECDWTPLAEPLTREEVNGPSVSEAMKRGLQAATVASSALTGEGVKYVKVMGDQVVEARVIPPGEFAEKGVGK